MSFWGILAALIAGIVLCSLPTPAGLTVEGQRLLAMTIVMAILWFGQFLPVAVTSLLPICLYPLLGIVNAGDACAPYANKNVFLFLGGFLIALGLEQSGLHRRLALQLVRGVGTGPRAIVFGFMLTTAFLSMWISNTASTMLMVPIALALLKTLGEVDSEGESGGIMNQLTAPTLLGISYGASVGGFATLVGTPTNVAFRGFWEDHFVKAGAANISAASWMVAFAPVSLVLLLLVGVSLTWSLPGKAAVVGGEGDFFGNRLRALGRMRRSEMLVAVLFVSTAVLWMTRVPLTFGEWTLLPGWTNGLSALGKSLGYDWTYLPAFADDGSIAICMGLLLFLIPHDQQEAGKPIRQLVTWDDAQRHIPWGMLLLIGAGFSMANAFDATGLSGWMGSGLAWALEGRSTIVLAVLVCIFVTFLTEFTTNVATLNMLLPVLAGVAHELNIPPLMVLLPATISCSCAFMLPIGTPPNAIVFGTGHVTMREMARTGFVLNLLGVIVVTVASVVWVPYAIEMKLDKPAPAQPAGEEESNPDVSGESALPPSGN
ncbi:MAG: SLC13 family permease [Planctomycetaceae bacterium]